jgi:hypothetical protein
MFMCDPVEPECELGELTEDKAKKLVLYMSKDEILSLPRNFLLSVFYSHAEDTAWNFRYLLQDYCPECLREFVNSADSSEPLNPPPQLSESTLLVPFGQGSIVDSMLTGHDPDFLYEIDDDYRCLRGIQRDLRRDLRLWCEKNDVQITATHYRFLTLPPIYSDDLARCVWLKGFEFNTVDAMRLFHAKWFA